ncbi:MAG: toxic anion resistance protein [Finegoldia sp.]|nr:toxic anion resistance protein [Finegoldia sp.]
MESNDNKIKLTLDVGEEEPALNFSAENLKTPDYQKDEIKLSDEEQKMVDDFVKQIDLNNSNVILQYGVGAQKKIANFSEKTLSSVKTKDLGEIGDLLSSVVVDLKSFDADEQAGGIKGFFKRSTTKIDKLKSDYQKVEKNVDDVAKLLENHQITLMKDISILDQMYELNEQYFKELSMYILAGKKKIDRVRNVDLPQLIREAEDSNNSMASQRVNDQRDLLNRFEKKIHDLELTRMVSLQMAPQIRMMQSSDAVMVEKIQSTLVNTIPIWKNQMVLALGAHHTSQAIKAEREVSDLTNKLLRKNADILKMNSVETAKATEKGLVDIDTIKYLNDQLISALTEVKDIQIQGQKNRDKASEELLDMERNLKSQLLDIAKNE